MITGLTVLDVQQLNRGACPAIARARATCSSGNGGMATISCEAKGSLLCVIKVTVEATTSWGRKRIVFRSDNEPAIESLNEAIQLTRTEETVVELGPKHSSPSMGPCENAKKEMAGVVRHIRAFLKRKTKVVINVQHPLAAFLIGTRGG